MNATTERNDYLTQLRLQNVQTNGPAIQVCGAVSGHVIESIAFCKDAGTAELIVSILKDHLETLVPKPPREHQTAGELKQ